MSVIAKRLDSLMTDARNKLRTADLDTPDLDARFLVEWATGATRLDMVSSPDKEIEAEKVELLEAAIERRMSGEPVHRIIGSREFYGRSFQLGPATLEPRPDTEALIELVLPYLKDMIEQHGSIEVLDMGTGTGAIIITLLCQFESMHGVGVDIADGALTIARINAQSNGVSQRFAALKSDWFSNVSGQFHLIVSNPPYIPHQDIKTLSREVREHDPIAALDGGEDGLDFYRALAEQAVEYLFADGLIAIEIGVGQFEDIRLIFEAAGFHLMDAANDLGGHRRAMIFTQTIKTEF